MNSGLKRFILDTNVLVSAALYPRSASATGLTLAFRFGKVYRSTETLQELKTVLNRAKFDRYFENRLGARAEFLALFEKHSTEAVITETSTDCIDPQDNMFLSLALSIPADILISGDRKHLIPLHPYRGTAILSITDFMEQLALNAA